MLPEYDISVPPVWFFRPKIVGGRGSAMNSSGGAHDTPPDPLVRPYRLDSCAIGFSALIGLCLLFELDDTLRHFSLLAGLPSHRLTKRKSWIHHWGLGQHIL
jgi:hypothetical protein